MGWSGWHWGPQRCKRGQMVSLKRCSSGQNWFGNYFVLLENKIIVLERDICERHYIY